MEYGFFTESMFSSRITKHGRITTLISDFTFTDGMPFSIFIVPTVDNDDIVTLSAKLYKDETSSNMPFRVKEWSPAMITKLDANPSILTGNTIYWGS